MDGVLMRPCGFRLCFTRMQTFSPRATHSVVTPTRFSPADRNAYDPASVPSSVSESLQLPFVSGEVWRVIQGYDSQGGSHNGYAAFCYDFVVATPDNSVYPNGTIEAPIHSASYGTLASYFKYGGFNSAGQETNVVNITTAPNEFLSYLHNEFNSINPDLDTGECNEETHICGFRAGAGPPVEPGEFLAKVGGYARHLHFAGLNSLLTGYFVTFPVPFDNYYASDDQGATWKYVTRGYPQK